MRADPTTRTMIPTWDPPGQESHAPIARDPVRVVLARIRFDAISPTSHLNLETRQSIFAQFGMEFSQVSKHNHFA